MKKRARSCLIVLKLGKDLATVCIGGGDTAGAVKKYNIAAKLNPKSFSSFFQLGFIRMEKGHYSTALKCFKRAVRIRPDSVEALFNIGQIFQKRAAITTKNLYNTTIRH